MLDSFRSFYCLINILHEVSHLKDFRSGNKKAKSRRQTGHKSTTCSQIGKTRGLAQDLFVKVMVNRNSFYPVILVFLETSLMDKH